MSRELTVGMATAVAAATVRPYYLFKLELESSDLHLNSNWGNLSYASAVWLGNGWFTGLSDIVEEGEINAHNLDIFLSGVPLSLISLLLSDAGHSSRGTIWLACTDSAGALIADPYLLFSGALSAPRIDDSGDTSQIVLSFEDDLVMLQRASELRANRESHQAFYPDDLGFDYVVASANWTGYWGNKEKPLPATTAKRTTRTTKKKGSRR